MAYNTCIFLKLIVSLSLAGKLLLCGNRRDPYSAQGSARSLRSAAPGGKVGRRTWNIIRGAVSSIVFS